MSDLYERQSGSVQTNSPLVSAIVPARNEELLIENSLKSLAGQTYQNLEIILVDDGSTDKTVEVAQSLAATNLRVVKGPGLGLARALAVGVAASRGEILIRQDADDFSLPIRVESQVKFLMENPSCVVVGTWAMIFDSEGKRVSAFRPPSRDSAIRLRLTLETGFAHPTVAMRKAALLNSGSYQGPHESPYPEDFDLWSRMQYEGELANIPEYLVRITSRPTGITRTAWVTIGQHASQIAARNLSTFVGDVGETGVESRLLIPYYVTGQSFSFRDLIRLEALLFRAWLRAGLVAGWRGYRIVNFLKPINWWLRYRCHSIKSVLGFRQGGLKP